ncbi:hypothetical protein CYMTET_3619 [Cymbomonas tetramitiformis]|uniref:Uncharacterized protein n=1 Tax=Cymbomonas tetramitiformis TaxID=36881 RepID=A0AAE0H2R7_9CHLO|nr:hypothetical protein CYMTET_3619 [Cymbomonas tetramitiformis]
MWGDEGGAANASVEEREGEELTDLAAGSSEFLGQSEEVRISPSVSLLKFRPQDVTEIITDVESINVSDLVPGKYEGGLKLWECAIDLIKFLSSKIDTGSLSIKDCKVLELGCMGYLRSTPSTRYS